MGVNRSRFLLVFAASSAVLLLLLAYIVIYRNTLPARLDRVIEKHPLNKTAVVAVSVRDTRTGKIVYDRYGDYLLHTASMMKAITTPLALDVLGEDRVLSTRVYSSIAGPDIYLRLGGDPLLSSQDLIDLFRKCKERGLASVKGDIIIDDTILDKTPWGFGWVWTNENHPEFAKISAFMVDHNCVTVVVSPGQADTAPTVTVYPPFDAKIVNKGVSSRTHRPAVGRRGWLDPEAIFVLGKFARKEEEVIPVGNPRKYFIARLKAALRKNNIPFNGEVAAGRLPHDVEPIAEVGHGLLEVVSHTNRTSDTFAAETLLKIVGHEAGGRSGNTLDGLKELFRFYTEIGASPVHQKIVDGSGASTYNLVQPNWITLALNELYKSRMADLYLSTLSRPGQEGTFKNRLRPLKDNVWVKSGTLWGISGVAGYARSTGGTVYAFAVLIQNFTASKKNVKRFEDRIIGAIVR